VLAALVLAAGAAKGPPPEVPDQPPAAESPKDNPRARGPAVGISSGPYVSIQVNVDDFGDNVLGDAANEPSIAVNPVNPLNMVIGWRQFNSVTSNFRQAGWAYTFDKGAHWTFPGVLTPGTFRSDPVIDVNAAGVFFYQSLKGDLTLDVFKSTNGGTSWGIPTPSFGGDKNWLAVDRSGGAANGNLYGIWQRFASCCDPNVLTRSSNGGTSFETPVPMAMSPTFGTMTVGAEGRIFAAGIDGTFDQDFDHFVVSHSTAPPTPGVPLAFTGRQVDLGGSMGFGGGPNPAGLLGQATIDVDRSSGPTRDNVYLIASVSPGGAPTDVSFARSSDLGQTWSAPVRINDDVPGTNWHWLAAHSVAPNGRIDVMWFDTRDSGQQNLSRLYYAYSWDAGPTWSANVPVSPVFDSFVGWPNQSKMGDYSTLVSDATGADAAYCATFLNEQNIYYVRLFPDCNGNGVSDVSDLATHLSQDCDLNHVPDECQAFPLCIGAGTTPDGGALPGTPLTLGKATGGALVLNWGASCGTADADYEVYEGSIGSFASRAPKACTTGGALTLTLTPAASSSYYLVVPAHADREGSYGIDGFGSERPQAAGACATQLIRTCGE
jgi:hypothetical protein